MNLPSRAFFTQSLPAGAANSPGISVPGAFPQIRG